jgi:acyl-coenzyme A synthetase/AMP-(fatty) acid ligase
MEKFAAGLLSIGLKQEDRILICGNNYSNLLIAVLGSARNGMVIKFHFNQILKI